MENKRGLIAVLCTETQNSEQQRILDGIIAEAQSRKTDIAVLSNLFNPLEPEGAECCENRIYRLAAAECFQAIIMISESFVSKQLRELIRQFLEQHTDIPVMLVGTALDGFHFPRINTSDADDLEAITAHLIETHGYRDLALLTGPMSLEVSVQRLEGFRRALQKHGIPVDPRRIYEGDFWYQSGEKLAKEMISGSEPIPQALICQNDYMAFGVLDAFADAGISIRGRMAVTGYEFVSERNLHTPLLTTYQRNRTELGRQAVASVMRLLNGEPEQPFSPPKGKLIHGMTCPCDISLIRQNAELTAKRQQQMFADWNLKSDLERQLTECTDLDAFANAMGSHLFLLRGVTDCWLCLREDWHRQTVSSDILICRNVNLWSDHTVFRLHRLDLNGIVSRSPEPAAFYWLPLCFQERLFGYCVLKYHQSAHYDDICRSFVKSVSNGLEFLRLKADVRYLLQCRTVSAAYDSMTGMFSAEGLQNAYLTMQNAPDAGTFTALCIRCCIGYDPLHPAENPENAVNQLMSAAEVLRRFQNGCISGRISEYDFSILFPSGQICLQAAVTADLLRVLPVGSFVCTAEQFSPDTKPDVLFQALKNACASAEKQYAEQKLLLHSSVLSEIRSKVYRHPSETHSIDEIASAYGFHPDYFNRKYKECFSVSYHQDCIRSKVLYAAHLLMHTDFRITEISEQCGYNDSKYFIRQFSAVTGCPPIAFRKTVSFFLAPDF